MKRYLAQSGIVAAGLLISQILFTIFVYQSNISLLKSLEVISDAGYVAVPNAHVMSGLGAFLPAFCGGLFFTLTAGAGLTLGTFILIYIWHFIFARRPEILFVIVILWEFGIYKASQTSSPHILTAAFLLVPGLVFILTIKWALRQKRDSGWKSMAMHLVVILVIGAAWLPNVNGNVFVNIRDQLLLSNPIGQTINSFYYRYTLYPAETFKSLNQKQLKTARIRMDNPQLFSRLEETLRRLDYLPVDKDIRVDLTVKRDGNKLMFYHLSQHVLQVKYSRFFSSPESTLKEFSSQTDRMQFLRKATFFSLITASPLLLYLLIYTLVSTGLVIIRHPIKRTLAAAALCVIIAMATAAPLYQFQYETSSPQNPQATGSLLQSENWRPRVRALKIIDGNDTGIAAHETAIVKSAKSPPVAERYWAAKVMDNSDSERTYQVLSQMLNDPHPNVTCMALYSLSNRDDQRAIAKIKRVLRTSGHWYIQWYAYNALKELGWIQPESV